ncbi:MAG TPA: diaminopimelate epimerase [Syntrophales bacterium]|nr:diaminopimelate epimerase [Syntrophales bacterium]HOL58936.1 diaminopimelate epimerase [Syntrophales bacterium]HPO36277.1 diaminopimelate epimerase [Syntrophales bacterium]
MIEFFKMSGSGNDFILIDNREQILEKHLTGISLVDFVRAVCRPHISLGADGVILIEGSKQADFSWRFFNSDGSEAEMCGNGGRCAARFAFIKGIARAQMSFETLAGIIDAYVHEAWVKIRMPDPADMRLSMSIPLGEKVLVGHFINTGVPHTVIFFEDLASCDVKGWGQAVRYHELFSPAGTNVNFVKIVDSHHLMIRTYERGVEGETLACGTGSVAAALLSGAVGKTSSPVEVKVASGEVLRVYFEKKGDEFAPVYLEGATRVICTGHLWEEAYH